MFRVGNAGSCVLRVALYETAEVLCVCARVCWYDRPPFSLGFFFMSAVSPQGSGASTVKYVVAFSLRLFETVLSKACRSSRIERIQLS